MQGIPPGTASISAATKNQSKAVDPNPFNPTTRFYIDVPEAGNLSVKVYDVNGKLVKELIDTYVNKGRVQSRWSGKNEFDMMSPTGIYFLRVETSSNYHVQKLALVK